MKMTTSRRSLVHNDFSEALDDAGRELFEACRTGDLAKVKAVVTVHNVNAKDTAGRKSSPLHFAAGNKHNLVLLLHTYAWLAA